MTTEYFPQSINKNIYLHPLKEEHASKLFQTVDENRDRLSVHLPWVAGTTMPEHSLIFIRGAITQEHNQTGLHCGIFDNCNGAETVVGCVGLRCINRHLKTAELGYWISRSHLGRGLCTQACRILIEYGMKLGTKKFFINAAVDNTDSHAVAERLGFKRLSGFIRNAETINGQTVDHVTFLLCIDIHQIAGGDSRSLTD